LKSERKKSVVPRCPGLRTAQTRKTEMEAMGPRATRTRTEGGSVKGSVGRSEDMDQADVQFKAFRIVRCIKTFYINVIKCSTSTLSSPKPNRTNTILVFPPGLKIAWKSTTLAKILPQPDSRHGCLRMSSVFVRSKRALNSSAT
jgi:hypothetical protein